MVTVREVGVEDVEGEREYTMKVVTVRQTRSEER